MHMSYNIVFSNIYNRYLNNAHAYDYIMYIDTKIYNGVISLSKAPSLKCLNGGYKTKSRQYMQELYHKKNGMHILQYNMKKKFTHPYCHYLIFLAGGDDNT